MKRILLSLLTVGAIVLAALPLGGAPVLAARPSSDYCTTTGSATVCTDKEDYAPEETVHISGSGFGSRDDLTIKVVRPDGSVVTGDGSFAPWPAPYDGVKTDKRGRFSFDYILDGIEGEYEIQVLDGPWDGALDTVLATHTFTDSRTITSVTLNGGTSVTVAPGASITVSITVNRTGTGTNNDWRSTSWRIGTSASGSFTCVDTPDHTQGSGSSTESFTITAPATPGTYNAYFYAYSNAGCSSGQSALFTLPNAVTVTGTLPSRTIDSVTLDGDSSVTVAPGDSIAVDLTTTLTGGGGWRSTRWRIDDLAWTCVDTSDHTSNGTYTETFAITVPNLPPGTYSISFRAYDGASCSGDRSDTYTMNNAITIEEELPAEPEENPTLDEACGYDLVLVLDMSASILLEDAVDDVKVAAHAFVNAFLPGTPSLMGLVRFNTTATVLNDLTSDYNALNSDINALNANINGYTNWEDALNKARGLLEKTPNDRNDSEHPDVIVIVTDGDPTASSAGPNNTNQPNIHLAPAIVAANTAKTSSSSQPIRIVAVGVGPAFTNPDSQSRLEDISGDNVSPPDPLTLHTDVILGQFTELADMLAEIASKLGACTITATDPVVPHSTGNIASVADAGTGATYDWSITNGTITGGDGTPQITWTAGDIGTTTIEATVTNQNGCSGTCTADVTVSEPPTCFITAPASVCDGSTGNSASGPEGMTGYSWSITGGTISGSTTTQTVTFSPGTGSTVHLSLTITNGGSQSSCSKDIPVIAKPNCTITAPTSVCEGATGVSAATISGLSSYTWAITGGAIDSGQGTYSITWHPTTTGSVTLKVDVSNASGCASHCEQVVTIDGNKPDCTITAPESVCNGFSDTASVISAGEGATYEWTITNGEITNGQGTNQITFTAGSVGTMTLHVTVTKNGCSSSCDRPVTVETDCCSSIFESCGHKIEFISHSFDGTNSTWTYRVTSGGGSTCNAISHWVMAQCDCDSVVSVSEGYECGQDPTTGVTGIKFGVGYDDYATRTVSFVLSGDYPECCVDIAIKAGENTCYGEITGPCCCPTKPACTITAPTTACAGSTGNTASGPDGMDSYNWSITGGTITGGQTAKDMTFTAGTGATVHLSLTITKGGCSSTCATDVTIGTSCSAYAPDFNVCQGTTLTDELFIQHGASGTLDYANVNTSIPGIYAYTATCGSGECGDTDIGFVAVVSSCQADAPDFTICQGTTIDDNLFTNNGATCSQTESGTLTIVSDTSTIVSYSSSGYASPGENAKLAWEPHSGTDPSYWDTSLTGHTFAGGADWIWESNRVQNPVSGSIVHFLKPFVINGTPTSGSIYITCDNGYELYINGILVSSAQLGAGWATSNLTQSFVQTSGWQSVESYNIFSYLVPGINVLEIRAADEYMGPLDGQADGTISSNPAGVIFEAIIEYEADCGMTLDYDFDGTECGSFEYTVICDNGPCESEAKGTVAVSCGPDCTITVTTPVCEGATGLSASTTSGLSSYSWSITGGVIDSGQGSDSITWHPTSTGTVTLKVDVSNTSGCSSHCEKEVVVNAGPTATAENNGPVCAGASVQLTGGPGGMASYSWTGPDGYTSNTQSPLVNPAVAGLYTLTVTDANGCSDSESTTVVVNAGPTATAENNGPVCAGASVQLTGGPGGMASYSWTGPDGFTSNTQSPLVNPAVAGLYTLTVTDANGCSDSESTTVVVNAGPTATAENNGPVCAGASVQLTGGPGGMASYSWTGPDGYTSNTQSPLVNPAVAGLYTLTVTDANGCSDSESTTVTVNAKPDCAITAPGSACAGATGLAASVADAGGSAVYAWTIDNGSITSAANIREITFSAGTTGTTTLHVTVTNGSGCSATCDKTVTVNAKPDCAITAPGSACAGATGLAASVADAGGSAVYAWTIDNGSITSAANIREITFSAGTTGTTTLHVTVTNGSGCSATCDKTVTVNAKPDCAITAPGSACAGATGLAASVADAGGSAVYAWTIDNGSITSAANIREITFSAGTTGTTTLHVTVTNGSGCSATCDKTVTVNAKPDCAITAPGSACAGATGLAASVADAGGSAVYAWTIDNGSITSAANIREITFSAGTTGTTTLHVTVTNGSGCSATCDKTVTVNAKPDCAITAPGSACAGATGLAASVADAGGSAVYAWTIDNGSITSAANIREITFSAGTTGTTTLHVTVTNGSGCSATCDKTVTVNAKPDCAITAPGSACAGATGLAASVADAGGSAVYAWTIDNGSITSAANIREITFSAGTTGTTTLHVTVTNGSGCSATCDKTVTVNAKPDCAITAPGSACAGATGLAASVADAGGSAVYAWTIDNGSITSAANIREITFSAGTTGTTTLHVTVTNGSGCSATCDKTVTVNAKPDCAITAPGSACAGATGLAASVADAGGSAVYAWTIDNGSITSAANIREITFSAGTTGTTTLHVTVTNGSGCSATCDKTVTVNAKPDCAITAPGSACAGATGLAASVADAGGSAVYAWTIDNGSITSAANIREITFSAGTTGTTTLHVTVTNGSGCSATCDKTVTVNAKPDCAITAPGSACAGATGLAASVADAGGSAVYAWTIDNGSITSAANIREITFSAGTTGTTTLHVTVTNGSGCSATCDKTVTVNAKPDCAITAPGSACAGATGLAASVADAGGSAVYAWTIDNGSITSAANIREITFSAGTTGTTTLHVTVTNGSGCSATCDKTVTVNAKPDCAITAPGSACAGATGLAASVADAGGSAVYAWTIDNGSITSAANIREITFSAGTTGTTTLHVTVTNGSGCSATCDKTVTVNAKPDCAITAPGSACAGATGLAASVADAGGSAVYAWTIDNGSITSAANIREITFSAGTTGTTTLHVTVTNGSGCSATCDKTVTVNAKPDCAITAPGSACAGATGLAASVADAGGSAVYAWTIDNGSITSAANIREITFSAGTTGTTTLHVTVTNGSGCSATCDKTVTVNAKPDCAITAPGSACAGATGLAASVADAGGSAVYAWTIDNGSITSAANIREITFSAGTTGTTTLHVTVTNGSGCSATCDKTVTVNAKPDCAITAPGSACAGATGLAASVADAGGSAVYAWTIDNGSITSAANIREITFSAGTTGTTTLHVTVTNGSGCSATCDKTVTVNAKPDCAITAPGSACAGATGLAASVADAGGSAVYAWTIDNGSITSAANIREITFSAGTTGTTTLHVTVTNGSGCSATCDKTVTVNAKPDCAITAPGSACAGATGLAASVADAGGSAVYAWTIDNGSITSAANIREITFSAGTTGTTTLHVTVTNGSGCSATCDKTVTVNAKPDCAITAPGSACAGATGLAASVADAGGSAVYAWTIDNGSITSAANIREITFSAGTTGTTTLHVTVTNGSGCSATCDKTVTVNAKPDCAITAPGSACAGATGLAASVADAGGSAVYAWTIDNGSITSAANIREITFSAGTTGTTTLHVTVTNGAGCSNTCDKEVTVTEAPVACAPDVTLCSGYSQEDLEAAIAAAGEVANPSVVLYGTEQGGAPGNVSPTSGNIYAIDVANGTVSLIFSTGLGTPSNPYYPNGNAFDTVNNRLYYSYNSGATNKLYFYDIVANSQTLAGNLAGISAGASFYNGKYYYIADVTDDLRAVSFNPDGTVLTDSKLLDITNNSKTFAFGDIVIYPDGTLYGSTLAVGGPGGEFFKIDLNTNTYTMISTTLSIRMQLAIGTDGVLYSHSAATGNWFSVDPSTGTTTGSIPFSMVSKFTDIASGPAVCTSGGCSLGNMTITDNLNGTYTIGCASGSCEDTALGKITVIEPPVCTITATTPVCEGAMGLSASTTAGLASYSWSITGGVIDSGQGSDSITWHPTSTGTVTLKVDVSNTSGCSSHCEKDVTVNAKPNCTASSNSPVCESGTINLIGGPTGAYTYSWSGPNSFTSTEQSPTVSTNATTAMSGTYTLTVTATGTNCTSTCTTDVTVNAKPNCTASSNSPVCESGTINLIGGSTGAYTYSWSGPNSFTSTEQSPTVSTNATTAMSGTYTLTVTAAGTNCTSTCTTDVTVNAKPNCTASSNSPVCESGTINLIGGPTGAYTYSWSGPNSFTSTEQSPTVSTNATTAMSGTYTLTVTAAGTNCTSTCTTDVTVNAKPDCTASSNSPVCEGGAINLIGGPTGAYTYSWSGPNSFTSTEQSPTVSTNATTAMSGTYTLTVTATGTNCTSTCTTDVTVNAKPDCTASSNSPVCEGGAINLIGGPTGAYTYSWSGPNSFTSTEQSPTVSTNATTAMSGTYTLTVTAAGTNCTSTCTTDVTVNAKPDCTASSNSPVCEGGAINLIGGPTGAYTYSWSGPNSFTSTGQSPTVSTNATTAMSGTYTLTVTAAGTNCTSTCTTDVTVNAKPDCTASSNSPVCEGGAINLIGGPTGAYTYSWSGPNSFTSTEQSPTVSTNATTAMSGTYTLTVTATGTNCTSTCTTDVTVNAKPDCTASSNSPVCEGGTINLIGGPTGAYTYSWSGPNSFTSTEQSPTVSTNATTAMSGTYTLTVTAAGTNCTSTCTTDVTVNAKPDCTASSNSPVCEGGTINLIGGPTGAYTYSWSGPNSFTSTEQSPTVSTNATTAMSGTYTLTVTATGTNCTSTCTTDVTVNAKPDCTASSNSPVCEGGTINLIGGPTGAYTYSWSGPNSFTSTEQSPTVSTNATTAMSGTYTLTVTATGTNCTSTCTTDVTVNAKPDCTASSNSPVCEGGTINLIGGPTGAYTYSWSGPNSFTSTEQSPTVSTNATTAMSGTYTLTVTATGTNCTSTCTTDVTVNAKPDCTASSNSPVCEGGTINLIGGPTGAYTYSWSGPNSFTSTEQSPTVSTNATTAMSGTYTLTVTATGTNCTSTCTTDVTVNAKPDCTASSNSPVCEGGTINLIGGPTGAYTYSWSGPNSFTSTEQSPTVSTNATTAMSGTYTLTVTATGCSCSSSINVAVQDCGNPPSNPPSPACSLQINMLGEVVEVDVDCCDYTTYASYLIYDPENQNFLSIDRWTPVICGDCVGCGAYPLEIKVTESENPPPEPDGAEFVGPVYDFIGYRQHGVACSSITFGKPVVLLFGYDPNDLPEDTTSVVVAFYNDENNTWEDLPADTGRVAEVGEATAVTTHFSQFAVLAKLGETTPPPPSVTPSTPPVPPTPEVAPAHFFTNGLAITPSRQQVGAPLAFVVRTGESVTIKANVGNDGGQQGSYLADLEVNGNRQSTNEVTLLPGQSQEVVFSIGGNKPGRHTVRLGDLTGEFETTVWVNWWLIGGLAAALGLGIWAGWYYGYHRRRKGESGA